MIAHLQAAAARRHDDVENRANSALKAMSRAGAPITFVAVARAAGISTDFLYRHPRLRTRIEDLRCSTAASRRQASPEQPDARHGTSSAVRAL